MIVIIVLALYFGLLVASDVKRLHNLKKRERLGWRC